MPLADSSNPSAGSGPVDRRAVALEAWTKRWPALLRWLGPVLIAMAGLYLAALTWKTWPDPIIDFGRELYVPWRILEGQMLYSQIAYHNGPLSPYLNALCFAVNGVSLQSLVSMNLLIVVAVCWLLYRMLVEVAGRTAATLGCITYLMLFAFGQFTVNGNYNWVCPYSHEMTHGIGLSLLAIYLVRRYIEHGVVWYAAASGLAVGLTFLTKGEVFLAGCCATAMAMVMAVCCTGRGVKAGAAAWAVWLAGALLPVVTAIILLGLAMPLHQAVQGTIGTWAYVFARSSLEQRFFRVHSGTDNVIRNALLMLILAAGYLVCFVPPAVAGLACRKPGRYRLHVAVAAGLLWAIAFAVVRERFLWNDWLRPLPLILLMLFAAGLIDFWLRRDQRSAAGRRVLRLALLCFAGLMLLKMVLNVRVGHYGFGLSMMGTVLLAAALVDWLPRAIDRLGGYGRVLSAAATVVWIAILLGHLSFIGHLVSMKTVTVGRGRDAFRADSRGALLDQAVTMVNSRLRPGQTLTTFVDCEMLNYLTRRPNPVPYGSFIPHQIAIFGEQHMLRSLAESPPDYVAIVHRQTSEYGVRYFGVDYGLQLGQWLKRNYQPVGPPLGAEPMRDERFGIALLQRVEAH